MFRLTLNCRRTSVSFAFTSVCGSFFVSVGPCLACAIAISISSLRALSWARRVCLFSNMALSASNAATLTFSFARADLVELNVDVLDRWEAFEDLGEFDLTSDKRSHCCAKRCSATTIQSKTCFRNSKKRPPWFHND